VNGNHIDRRAGERRYPVGGDAGEVRLDMYRAKPDRAGELQDRQELV
jgi:hypothetical protein